MIRENRLRLILLVIIATACCSNRSVRSDEPSPPGTQHSTPFSAPIKVILWFDTEDYLLPADDDADKRIAEMLTARHIRGTFKVVGEKARVLEKRGRKDVIDAIRQHDIGYHSNLHSVHPAPTEYLADCGLLDGIEEFVRREARGAADVRRIFNVPSLVCYGQPGSSWAPQAIAALPQCGVSNDGIPCYVDNGSQIGLGGKPFWYCGALNVFDMRGHETRMSLVSDDEPREGNRRFDEMAKAIKAEGGGVISICYHPCEFVHQEFWDSVNFKRGANPPREEWKPPRQRPAAETEQAFKRYGEYLDHMAATPGVVFISASQLPYCYPDRLRNDGATAEEVAELAQRITAKESKGIGFQLIGNKAFSPADQFALLATMLDRPTPAEIAAPAGAIGVPKLMLGPDGEPPAAAGLSDPLKWTAFRDAVHDADDFVQVQHRIPARVFIGPDAIAPTDFLFGMASAYLQVRESKQFPERVSLGMNVPLLAADYVAKTSPQLYGGWIIHRENFEAPHVLEIARLQAWTLKPAMAFNANVEQPAPTPNTRATTQPALQAIDLRVGIYLARIDNRTTITSNGFLRQINTENKSRGPKDIDSKSERHEIRQGQLTPVQMADLAAMFAGWESLSDQRYGGVPDDANIEIRYGEKLVSGGSETPAQGWKIKGRIDELAATMPVVAK